MSNPFLAYYADDFTGATDVLDILSQLGLSVSLFLKTPLRSEIPAGCDVVGVAGTSRAMAPEELQNELSGTFHGLRELEPQFLQYKICSTFDSSPQRGSIGKAIEIGQEICGPGDTPLVVGVPHLGRFVAFGNLFARAGADPFAHRLDRHPVMATHPSTPMGEADLGRHLATMTDLPVRYVDLPTLRECSPPLEAAGRDVVIYDAVAIEDLRIIGRHLTGSAEEDLCRFVVGSSGLDYALGSAHARNEAPPMVLVEPSAAAAVDQILVVSGSQASVTHHQIERSQADGYKVFTVSVNDPRSWYEAQEYAIDNLQDGASVIVRTGERAGVSTANFIPAAISELTTNILAQTALQRLVLCGGDTSGAVGTALGIERIDYLSPVSPGAPLCTIHTSAPSPRDLTVAFKGGQMGSPDYFERVRLGGAKAAAS